MVLASPVRVASPLPAFDHERAPLLDAVRAYRAAGTQPFSTPGHKLGAGADAAILDLVGADAFAADGWLFCDELDAVRGEAEALAADAWGADRAWFLVNGSSSGNQALLLAALAPGDEVVVARDAHRSLQAALILTGARPVYVAPRVDPVRDIPLGIDPADVAAALDTHPRARLVAITSPSYWGTASDIAAIADVAHARGVPLYVDDAWGPHLPFHPDLPPSATAAGADAAVTSPHKLLTALGQGAMLRMRGPRIDGGRVGGAVRMTQTTSPSLAILASLDATRRQAVREGFALLERTIALAGWAHREVDATPGLSAPSGLTHPGVRRDPTRLVVDVGGLGVSGLHVERELRARFGVAPEMADLRHVVFLITVGDTAASIGRLLDGLSTIAGERCGARPLPPLPSSCGAVLAPGEQALTPRDAYFAPARAVPLADAAGAVAAEAIVPYPPGIPVVVPGEVIALEKVAYLREACAVGMYICGAADPTLTTVRVVDRAGMGRP